ncbi:NAD-P-binding protein [Mycena polygramma]|nr:NAD-P-binding protein [Mycena polygramma]
MTQRAVLNWRQNRANSNNSTPMAPTINARVLLNSLPTDYPVPGETTVYDASQTIDLETNPLNGGFLSVDPYFRGLMNGGKSMVPGFALGEPLHGFGVGIVVRSENSEVNPGKYVYGMGFLHQEYFVLPSMEGFIFLEKHPKLPWTVYLGAAGMTGKTAYGGWKEHSRAKKGETAFVTAGAGAVGSSPKRDGLKDEKVQFMRSIGADVAFNYKTTDTREVLAREGPIDVYWDNVGGSFLEAVFKLEHTAVYGRLLECGMVTGYNGKQQGIKLVSGELKYSEDVRYGLEKVGDVLLAVQKGKNNGKAVVVVSEE